MPARIESIAQAWEDYRSILLRKAGPTQARECRRAFYAGAESFFAMMAANMSETSEVRQSDVDYLANLQAELVHFAMDVRKGLA